MNAENPNQKKTVSLLGQPEKAPGDNRVYVIKQRAKVGQLYKMVCPECGFSMVKKVANVGIVHSARRLSVLRLSLTLPNLQPIHRIFLRQGNHRRKRLRWRRQSRTEKNRRKRRLRGSPLLNWTRVRSRGWANSFGEVSSLASILPFVPVLSGLEERTNRNLPNSSSTTVMRAAAPCFLM